MGLHQEESGKTQVLHLLPPSIGGLRSHVLTLLEHLDRSEFDLAVAGPPGFQDSLRIPRCEDVKFHTIELAESIEPFGMVYHTMQLTALLLREKCTILHAHGVRATIAAGIGGFPAEVRISSIYSPIHGILTRHLLGMAVRAYSHCSGSSQTLREQIIHLGVPKERSSAIPTGVVPHHPTEEEIASAFQDLGVVQHTNLVIVLSRYLPHDSKWINQFVTAINSRDESVRLCFVGDAPGNGAFQSFRRKNSDNNRLVFSSFPESIRALAAASKACVLVDPLESTPLVLAELMASGGAAIIAGNRGEIQETIIDGANGRLIEPDDAEGFSEAVLQVVSDTEMKQRISLLAREQALENFSASAMVRRTEALYREMYENEIGNTGIATI